VLYYMMAELLMMFALTLATSGTKGCCTNSMEDIDGFGSIGMGGAKDPT